LRNKGVRFAPTSDIAPLRLLTGTRPFPPCASAVKKICRTLSIPANPVRRSDAGRRAGSNKEIKTMRVMVIVKATEDIEKGVPPTQEAMEAMHKYGEAMAEAGIVLVDGAGLMNSSHGKRFAFDGGSVTVIDGPFAETRELIAGYSVWEVKDMDEAVAWAKRWPASTSGRSEIEIRPLFMWDPADETFTEKVL
jgi:hypothetical protein